jgi:hypothetical protein
MAEINPQHYGELTNALQSALLLAVRLEQAARDYSDLRESIERAVTAARQLREQEGEQPK